NPIAIIDVNGDSVVINDGKEKFEYRGGKLYEYGTSNAVDLEARSRKKSFWGKVSEKLFGDFVKDTYAALQKVESGGPKGKELVGKIVESSLTTTIVKSSGGAGGFIPSTNTIVFDPRGTFNGVDAAGRVTNDPAFVGLSHELGHAIDLQDGDYGYDPWFTTPNGTVSVSEKEAMRWENSVRAEHGIVRRGYYTINSETGKPVGEAPKE
ncbi:MAG: hypothetical protein KDC99_19875, partial [Cyclobacteriaceae bacterium]|nr:hypothetical protein [Cyclobacteriaceae bacterium]